MQPGEYSAYTGSHYPVSTNLGPIVSNDQILRQVPCKRRLKVTLKYILKNVSPALQFTNIVNYTPPLALSIDLYPLFNCQIWWFGKTKS